MQKVEILQLFWKKTVFLPMKLVKPRRATIECSLLPSSGLVVNKPHSIGRASCRERV